MLLTFLVVLSAFLGTEDDHGKLRLVLCRFCRWYLQHAVWKHSLQRHLCRRWQVGWLLQKQSFAAADHSTGYCDPTNDRAWCHSWSCYDMADRFDTATMRRWSTHTFYREYSILRSYIHLWVTSANWPHHRLHHHVNLRLPNHPSQHEHARQVHIKHHSKPRRVYERWRHMFPDRHDPHQLCRWSPLRPRQAQSLVHMPWDAKRCDHFDYCFGALQIAWCLKQKRQFT